MHLSSLMKARQTNITCQQVQTQQKRGRLVFFGKGRFLTVQSQARDWLNGFGVPQTLAAYCLVSSELASLDASRTGIT